MQQLFSWGWDGLILVVVALLALRSIPVAFDAWKTGNVIVGAVKTVGPIVTLAALLYGGYMVIKEATGYIVTDAKSAAALQEARQWTAAGAGAIESGAGDLGSGLAGYAESFRSEWSAGATTDATAGADSATAPVAPTAAPAAAVAPTATPGTAGSAGSVWTVQGINALRNGGAPVVAPTPTPAPTYGPAPKPAAAGAGAFFPVGNGGGPAAADADRAVAAVTTPATYTVKGGDDLTKISMAVYKNKHGAAAICNANRSIIRDCNVLRVGWVLAIPALPNK
jgi:nucleoid-associated protein YgaU